MLQEMVSPPTSGLEEDHAHSTGLKFLRRYSIFRKVWVGFNLISKFSGNSDGSGGPSTILLRWNDIEIISKYGQGMISEHFGMR